MTILQRFYIFIISVLIASPVSAIRLDETYHDENIDRDEQTWAQFVHIDASDYPVLTSEEDIESASFNGLCTRFTTEIYTGLHAPHGYKIELRYPEFCELTAKEKRLLQKNLAAKRQTTTLADRKSVVSDSTAIYPMSTPVFGLHLEQYVSVSQKKDYINVSFSPVVYHNKSWKRIVSCQLKITPVHAIDHHAPAASSAERWAEKSVLSTGKWVKVRVEEEGIYQLNNDDVKKLGFSDLSKVKVYGYGGLLQPELLEFPEYKENVVQQHVPDDLVEIPVHETGDGRILFWMEGTLRKVWNAPNNRYTHVNNHYSRYSYYLITENDAKRLTPSRLTRPQASAHAGEDVQLGVVKAVPHISIIDPNSYNWYSGGRRLFDSFDFQTKNNHSYRVLTPDCIKSDDYTPYVTVCIASSSRISQSSFDISLNGSALATQTIDLVKSETDYAKCSTKYHPVPSTLSLTDSNILQFTTNGVNSCRLDYLSINYLRALTATASPYSFSIPDQMPVTLQIADASSATHLWRIGQNGVATEEIETRLNGNILEADIYTPQRRFVFFDDTKSYSSPEYVCDVENQNLHADRNVDFVIIVPASGKLVEQAERLGKLHETRDGLSYKVVRADQLYNEFSSGTPDASAYRRYLKMLYDRSDDAATVMPRYCLLMGKSPWDNRFLTDYWSQRYSKIDDYLLSYEADNSTENISSVNSYVSDDFYGILDDGEGANIPRDKVDVALGRMVCLTSEDAELLIDKVERYMSNAETGTWKNTIAMLADDGDDNNHMRDSEAVATVIESVDPALNIKKHYWDRYKWTSSATGYSYPQATADIKKQMKDGALLFNYSGHGSPILISHQKVLNTNDFSEVYSPYMPLWVLASCEIYPFDHDETNLAEVSLFLRDGGSIAFVCSTRAVYASYNNVFNRAYCGHVLSKDDDGKPLTIGDALRMSKNDIVNNNTDLTINKLKYVLYGDPALRLALPSRKVMLDSINGESVADLDHLVTLPAGSVVDFTGHVCLDDNETCDTTFDGEVSATIYDAVVNVTCQNNQRSDNGPFVFPERQRIIYKGTTQADKGSFNFKIVIPRDISYSSQPGRISFYAVTADKQTEYKGISECFSMNGSAETPNDQESPKIVAYINSIDNPDYAITDANPVLIADISDASGINTSGLTIGHDIELILDGNATDYISLNDFFTYDFNSYQKGQVVYQLKDLAPGNHTATIRAWDIYNNLTTTDVHFIVSQREAKMGKNGYVTATQNPASTATRLIAYHPTDIAKCEHVTFEIYDKSGALVARLDANDNTSRGCSILNWNLCAHNGNPLGSGVYFFRAIYHGDSDKRKSSSQKLIIAR